MTAIVSGRVLGRDGAPVAGARVFFAVAPVALPDIAALSGSDGSFAIEAPAPGEYRLSVHGEGETAAVDLQIGSQDATSLEVRLGKAEPQD